MYTCASILPVRCAEMCSVDLAEAMWLHAWHVTTGTNDAQLLVMPAQMSVTSQRSCVIYDSKVHSPEQSALRWCCDVLIMTKVYVCVDALLRIRLRVPPCHTRDG
jgi:hypothetical protein